MYNKYRKRFYTYLETKRVIIAKEKLSQFKS